MSSPKRAKNPKKGGVDGGRERAHGCCYSRLSAEVFGNRRVVRNANLVKNQKYCCILYFNHDINTLLLRCLIKNENKRIVKISMTDIFSPKKRSEIMSRIRSAGSKMEKKMESLLSRAEIDYEEHPRDVIGRPDFIIRNEKIAIFCDSEFWHGHDWKNRKRQIKTRKEFWIKKIENNIRRDGRVNKLLRKKGWKVLRFWSLEINKNPDLVIKKIIRAVKRIESGQSA